MERVQSFERQFRYDDWANGEAIASLRTAVTPSPRAIRFMAHIVGTERLWLARLEERPSPMGVWPDFDVEECEAERKLLPGLWSEFLRGIDAAGFERPVRYVNSKGEPWSSRVDDILIHVLYHSAYHRGQIASDLRQNGQEPANTDYIHAIRQGLVS